MRAGVAVAAHDRGAGQGQAKLRPDDVHDALAAAVEIKERHAERARVVAKRLDLLPRQRIGNGQVPRRRRHVVIDGRERQIRPAHFASGEAQTFERLRRRDLVHQVPVDVEQGAAVFELAHDVRVPDLVEQNGAMVLRRHGRNAADLECRVRRLRSPVPFHASRACVRRARRGRACGRRPRAHLRSHDRFRWLPCPCRR